MTRWATVTRFAVTSAAVTLAILTSPAIAAGLGAQSPLTATPGNAREGERVFNDRDKGHCLLCHQLASNPAPFQGNLAPPLDGIGQRLSQAEIRFRIVDISRLLPASIMPAYFSTEGLTQVAQAYEGKPVLTAQEVEHVVAYLAAEKEK